MRTIAYQCRLVVAGDPQLKAIRLWSDWNVDIAEWSAKHQDGVTFDYLQIRTEDLVDNETK